MIKIKLQEMKNSMCETKSTRNGINSPSYLRLHAWTPIAPWEVDMGKVEA
jgi:hypothetical protein